MSELKEKIPQGYKQTEVGIIPEDWEVKKLRDIANYRRGSFPQPYGLEKWYDNKFGMPFVQVVDVSNNFKLKRETKQKISKEGAKLSVFVKKGTVILTIQGSIGRICITQYDSYVDRTLLIFQSFKEKLDKYFFMLKVFEKFEIEKEKAPGGIIKTITKDALSFFEISYPTNQLEQTAIANVLSDTDTLIEKLEKLIDKKKAIKQGAMQELLTGKKRLPGFSGEWEVKRLGDIIIKKNKTKRKSADGLGEGKYPFFTNATEKYSTYLNEYDFNDEMIIANTGGIAFFDYYNGPFAVMSDCLVIESKEITNFIFYKLKLNEPYINDVCFTGSGLKHLDKKLMMNINMNIPESKEQTAIAKILSNMDKEIEILEKKLEKYKKIKVGMMQQLLTGKTRIYEPAKQ